MCSFFRLESSKLKRKANCYHWFLDAHTNNLIDTFFSLSVLHPSNLHKRTKHTKHNNGRMIEANRKWTKKPFDALHKNQISSFYTVRTSYYSLFINLRANKFFQCKNWQNTNTRIITQNENMYVKQSSWNWRAVQRFVPMHINVCFFYFTYFVFDYFSFYFQVFFSAKSLENTNFFLLISKFTQGFER